MRIATIFITAFTIFVSNNKLMAQDTMTSTFKESMDKAFTNTFGTYHYNSWKVFNSSSTDTFTINELREIDIVDEIIMKIKKKFEKIRVQHSWIVSPQFSISHPAPIRTKNPTSPHRSIEPSPAVTPLHRQPHGSRAMTDSVSHEQVAFVLGITTDT